MNSKNTKKALFSSVLALVLCFSMMLGTTFAWFTDSVTSTNNIIKAGNLDVDVVDGSGNSIQDRSALFEGILWEPGVVAYENLTVQNLGTLALDFALTINFDNENFVVENGNRTDHSLATALKVAVVDRLITENDRDALLSSITQWESLADLVKEGKLYPENNMPKDDEGNVLPDAASEQSYGVVIYWQPGENDNNWNVQNGKTTSDGEKYLHINLGVNLLATQLTYEEDSFDELYDEGANVAVPPIVPSLQTISFPAYDIFNTGIGNKDFTDAELDIYEFVAEHFQGAYPVEEYKDWTCDFFVSSDKALKEGLVLVGNYGTFEWLGFYAPASDEPYEPTGLLGAVTSGGASNWTYEGICNDVQVFRCGLIDDLGENAGTEITVELRMTSPDGSEIITVNSIKVIL